MHIAYLNTLHAKTRRHTPQEAYELQKRPTNCKRDGSAVHLQNHGVALLQPLGLACQTFVVSCIIHRLPESERGREGDRGGGGVERESRPASSAVCPRLHYRLLTLCPATSSGPWCACWCVSISPRACHLSLSLVRSLSLSVCLCVCLSVSLSLSLSVYRARALSLFLCLLHSLSLPPSLSSSLLLSFSLVLSSLSVLRHACVHMYDTCVNAHACVCQGEEE